MIRKFSVSSVVCPLVLIFEMFWYLAVYNINEYHDTMYQIVYVGQVVAIVQSSSHTLLHC